MPNIAALLGITVYLAVVLSVLIMPVLCMLALLKYIF